LSLSIDYVSEGFNKSASLDLEVVNKLAIDFCIEDCLFSPRRVLFLLSLIYFDESTFVKPDTVFLISLA
jgi:hypothetical protein